MNEHLPTYDEARMAIRGGNNPLAFLHLGIIYSNGIGVLKNHVLANYFFDKALNMGCKEAEQYIDQEYSSGARDLVSEIRNAAENISTIAPVKLEKLKKQMNRELLKKNYGTLSMAREHLELFYPNYNQTRAIDDILANRHTEDADVFYALCTKNNGSEVNVEALDNFLTQLHSPITEDKELFQTIVERDITSVLTNGEEELLQCLCNLTASYCAVCGRYQVERKELFSEEDIAKYPYIRMSTLTLLRRQAFRCLLSVRNLDPVIAADYLGSLDNDERLLTACEKIKDFDLQLFLISFVELNIDIEALGLTYQSLRKSYMRNDLDPLASYLNDYIGRLDLQGLNHQLSFFNSTNLPFID